MKKILESEYLKAKETIEEYENILKCEHKNTVNRVFYDAGPYGQNFSYDECQDCGEWLNFVTF